MAEKKPRALVVGGSSGLGKKLSMLLLKTHRVTVTGTTEKKARGNKPAVPSRCSYFKMEVGGEIEQCLPQLRKLAQTSWDIIVWAAGYEREDLIDGHGLEDLKLMTNVTYLAPAQLMAFILKEHGRLSQLVLISGMVDDDEQGIQPVMAPARQALASFSLSMWRDERVGSVMHAAPPRMRGTYYYTGTERDTGGFADVKKVAERIHTFMKGRTKYRELYFRGDVAFVHRQDYSQPILGEMFS